MPDAVVEEFRSQVTAALEHGNEVTYLEVDSDDAMKNPFKSALETAVKTALKSVGTNHPVFRKIQDDDFLPILLDGTHKKREKIVRLVKTWAQESATAATAAPLSTTNVATPSQVMSLARAPSTTKSTTPSSGQKRSPSTAATSSTESPSKRSCLE